MKMSRGSGWWLLAVPVALAVVGLASAQPQQPGKAFVRVLLPPGADTATVAFGMQVTKEQTGRDRLFETPMLEPGKKYYYEVTASWKADGKDMKRKQKVYVNPGATAVADFSKADMEDKSTESRTEIETRTKKKSEDTKQTDTKTEDTKSDTKSIDTKKPDTKSDTKTEETKKQQAQALTPQDRRLAAVSEACWIRTDIAIVKAA